MRVPSAAEAKLDARIRPDITVMRSLTPYPRRRRPTLNVLDGGPDHRGLTGEAVAGPAAAEASGRALPYLASATRSASDMRRRVCPHGSDDAAGGGPGRLSRPRAVPAATAARPVRLTRRGKIVLGILALAAVASAAVLIWLAVGGRAQAAQQVGSGTRGSDAMLRVVVQPGQTLWSIAVRADPAADPRLVVQQIVADNALRGTALQAGQVLWVPRT